jgi:hypothetical protein
VSATRATSGSRIHRAREGAPLKVAFHADDVEQRRAELVARGARMGDVQRTGDLAFCDGTDPEGNVFGSRIDGPSPRPRANRAGTRP